MKKLLFSALVFFSALATNAQWSGSPTAGTLVSTSAIAGSKTGLVAATDGAGGMFLAWIDTRIGSTNTIYVQRLLANGTVKFVSDVVVSNATGATSSSKSNLYMTADGVGGVVLVWQDSRNRSATYANDDIYGQRIDANGNVLWTVNGVQLTVSGNSVSNKTNPVVEVVNATEAIVVFRDNRNSTPDYFAQKITLATGATAWAADVDLHGAQDNTQTAISVLRDGAGGLFAVWEDPRSSTTDRAIYGQRISNSGSLLWGTGGKLIANAANNQLTPQITSDGAGGIAVVYTDQRLGSSDGNIYAQRLDANGNILWTANGVAVTTVGGTQSNPLIIQSGTDFIVAWNDQRLGTSNRDIYAQKIAGSNGDTLWSVINGVGIANAALNQPSSAGNYVMLPDDAGGAVLVYEDARNTSSNIDIYAQRVNSSGVVQWTANGVPVNTAALNQAAPVAVAGTGGTFLTAWQDSRSGLASSEIFASRLLPNGTLPVRSVTINAVAKSASVDVRWTTVDETNTANFVVEKSVDGVHFSAIGSVKAIGIGNGSYLLEDKLPAKGTNYYRIKSVDANRSFAYSSTVALQFGGATKPGIAVYPNPVAQSATVRLVNLVKGNYVLSLRDFSGRLVLQQTVSVAADYQQVSLPLQQLTAGAYLLQVGAEGKTPYSLLIQKQ